MSLGLKREFWEDVRLAASIQSPHTDTSGKQNGMNLTAPQLVYQQADQFLCRSKKGENNFCVFPKSSGKWAWRDGVKMFFNGQDGFLTGQAVFFLNDQDVFFLRVKLFFSPGQDGGNTGEEPGLQANTWILRALLVFSENRPKRVRLEPKMEI